MDRPPPDPDEFARLKAQLERIDTYLDRRDPLYQSTMRDIAADQEE